MENIKSLLEKMCPVDKATLVNLLRKEMYSATPLEGCPISAFIGNYNKKTNIIIDSYLWKVYGLHYKDYLEVIGPYIGIDVIKLDKKLDSCVEYLLVEVNEKIFYQQIKDNEEAVSQFLKDNKEVFSQFLKDYKSNN